MMRRRLLLGATITVLVLVWVTSLRFIFLPEADEVHYHASFAIYLDGNRLPFTDTSYYEEVSACSVNSANLPHSRTHMHQPDSSVIHVHDRAVTWGHFLANLGFVLGHDRLQTPTNIYQADQDKKLRFLLNGKPAQYLNNKVIGDLDTLLIDYSADNDQVLEKRYRAIDQSLAVRANLLDDPNACQTSQSETFADRWLRAIKTLFN